MSSLSVKGHPFFFKMEMPTIDSVFRAKKSSKSKSPFLSSNYSKTKKSSQKSYQTFYHISVFNRRNETFLKNLNPIYLIFYSKKNSNWYNYWMKWAKQLQKDAKENGKTHYTEICKIKIQNNLFTTDLFLTDTHPRIWKITFANWNNFIYVLSRIWKIEHKYIVKNKVYGHHRYFICDYLLQYNILGIDLTDDDPKLVEKINKTSNEYYNLVKQNEENTYIYSYLLHYPHEGYFFPYIKQRKTKKFNNIGIEIECKKLYSQ